MLRWFETRIDPFRAPPPHDPPPRVLGFCWHFIRQAPIAHLALFVLGGFRPVIEALLFVYLGRAVDVMSTPAPDGDAAAAIGPLFYQIPALLLLSLLCGGLFTLISNQTIPGPFTSLIQWQNHRKVMRRPLRFFQGEMSGRIGAHVAETGNTVRMAVVNVVVWLWFTVIFLITAGVILASLDWIFLLPLTLWLVGNLTLLSTLTPRFGHAARIHFDKYSRLSGEFVDSYANVTTVKLFGGTAREDGHLRAATRRMLTTLMKMMRLNVLQITAVLILDALLIGTIFLLSLYLWRQGSLPIGSIVVATGLAIRLQGSSSSIVGGLTTLFQSIGTLQNTMHSVAPAEPEPPPRPDSGVPIRAGSIRFDGVGFAYPNGARVLDNLSFEIPARHSLGIAGSSGAGKTTIVNLLTGLYAPESGSIQIDGRDIASLSEAELWSGMTVVTQDPQMFHRSVRENIGYGQPNVTDAQIESALRQAGALDFVAKLVDAQGRRGLDAYVGERGAALSGGQRQRLGIARALLKDAPILVFDEATSALDSATEAIVQETLSQLLGRKTILVIAHRLSTLAALERVIVLDGGRIAESGSHDELVRQGGIYAGFWRTQSKTGSENAPAVEDGAAADPQANPA